MIEQQTDLDLREVIKRYNYSGFLTEPDQTFWIKEVGAIAAKGDGDAELFLSRIINEATSRFHRAVAFICLRDLNVSERINFVIEQFESNPENMRLVEKITTQEQFGISC